MRRFTAAHAGAHAAAHAALHVCKSACVRRSTAAYAALPTSPQQRQPYAPSVP